MNQPKLSDLYISSLLKLYYKLYRNRLPTYFECFLPEYGDHRHNLRNDLIRLPIIRCEFEEINTKYQMHRTLRDLSSHGNSVLYPNIQIKVLEKCTKKLIGHSRLAFNNHESNID